MIQKILVPTDFSPCADKAIEFAADLAGRNNSQITLLSCFQVPIVTTDITYTYDVELVKKFQEDSEVRFKDLQSRIPALEDIKYDTVIDLGYPKEGIIENLKSGTFDLLVMGTKGASGVAGNLLGSISASVLQSTRVPVIIVPEEWQMTNLKKIALASDYQKLPSLAGFGILEDLVCCYESELFIVNVKPDIVDTSAEEAFEAKSLDEHLTGLSHSFHSVSGADVGHALEQFISEKEIDLLAMVPRDHAFLERLFHKSMTRQVALHTTTPILSLR